MLKSPFRGVTQVTISELSKDSEKEMVDRSPSSRTHSFHSSEGSVNDLLEIYEPLSPSVGGSIQSFSDSLNVPPKKEVAAENLSQSSRTSRSSSVKSGEDNDALSRPSVTARAMSTTFTSNPLAGKTNIGKFSQANDGSNTNISPQKASKAPPKPIETSQVNSPKSYVPVSPMSRDISAGYSGSGMMMSNKSSSYKLVSNPMARSNSLPVAVIANGILGPAVTDIGGDRAPSAVEATISAFNEKSRSNSISSKSSSKSSSSLKSSGSYRLVANPLAKPSGPTPTSSAYSSPEPVILPPEGSVRSKSTSIDASVAQGRPKSYALVSNPLVADRAINAPTQSKYISVTPLASMTKPPDLTFEAQPLSPDTSKSSKEEKLSEALASASPAAVSPEASSTEKTTDPASTASFSEPARTPLTRTMSVREKAALFTGQSIISPEKNLRPNSSKPKTNDAQISPTNATAVTATAAVSDPSSTATVVEDKRKPSVIKATKSSKKPSDNSTAAVSQVAEQTTAAASTAAAAEPAIQVSEQPITFLTPVKAPDNTLTATTLAAIKTEKSSIESAEKHLTEIVALERRQAATSTTNPRRSNRRWRFSRWNILELIVLYLAVILLSIYANDSKAFLSRMEQVSTGIMVKRTAKQIIAQPRVKSFVLSNLGHELVLFNENNPLAKLRIFLQPINLIKLLWSKVQGLGRHIRSSIRR
jgi:hypothetical protein